MRSKGSERLSGAYALHALSPSERADFEACMIKSESLRAEVTELQDTAVLLGQAIPTVEPPAHLRTRILAQIENTPQLAPEPERSVQAKPVALLHRLRARVPAISIGLPIVAAAALALIIAVPLATPTVEPQQPVATGVSAIIAAPDSNRANVQAGVANAVTVVWSRKLQKAAVKVNQNDLPPGKAYELWVVSAEGAAQPAGLIPRGAQGWTELNTAVPKGASVRMTVEPKWGSKQPTAPTLFELSV